MKNKKEDEQKHKKSGIEEWNKEDETDNL